MKHDNSAPVVLVTKCIGWVPCSAWITGRIPALQQDKYPLHCPPPPIDNTLDMWLLTNLIVQCTTERPCASFRMSWAYDLRLNKKINATYLNLLYPSSDPSIDYDCWTGL